MNRHETFHTYGLKPKLLFCLNISALCSCYQLNHRAPILTAWSQRTAQHLWLGCISCFPPPHTIAVSLLPNAFSSSRSSLRSRSHEYLASSQSCLAIDDSNSHVRHKLPHILLCSQRLCTTSLCARFPTITPPPCLHATPASHPLILVEQNPNILYFMLSGYFQSLCSSSVIPQSYYLGYSCNSGIALTLRKATRLDQTDMQILSPKLVMLDASQPNCISPTLVLQALEDV